MTRGRAIASLVIGIATVAAPLSAHDAAKAIVELRPGTPRVGESCAVSVSVLAPPGVPLLDQIQGVRIIGEMTGHAMTPVGCCRVLRTSESRMHAALDPE